MNYTKLIFSFKKRRHNLLIFRNFTILLTGMILLSTTGALAQKGNVSVNINNGTVKTFIKEIEKQTRYTFVYRNNVLNDQSKVTVNCKNKPLDQVLSQVFTPLNVSYSLNNNTIVLVKQEVQQQKKNEKKTIKGTVTDGKGEPIIGANVIQEGGIGTITDVEGNFTVTADLSKPLEISYIGYKKKSIRIGASPTINIALEEDAHVMDEVIVIGYGSKTKRDVTSSIGTYKPGEVNVRQVLGVDELLQGRVSGVNITSASGVPGSKNRVSIRGIGSITAGNEPLYVIDGVPINNTSGDTGAWGAQSMNGLNDFNPSDVESIQILKDAASAAIYGYTWNSTKFVNTRMLHDASYIRCRTASIGYTLPKSWINRIHIDNLRIYFQADNLFILTKWPYLDPEVNVSLSATNMGYDYLYPSQPRTFTIGVNLKF